MTTTRIEVEPKNLQIGDIVGGAPIASVYETSRGVVVTRCSLGAESRWLPGNLTTITVYDELVVTELQRLLRRCSAALKETRQQLELSQGREQALSDQLNDVLGAVQITEDQKRDLLAALGSMLATFGEEGFATEAEVEARAAILKATS